MNSDFLRREWGAVAFLVATALGIIVVPVGLNLAHRPAVATGSLIATTRLRLRKNPNTAKNAPATPSSAVKSVRFGASTASCGASPCVPKFGRINQ